MPNRGSIWVIELILLLLLALSGLAVYEFLMDRSGLSDIVGGIECSTSLRLGVKGSGLNLTYSIEERLGSPGETGRPTGELIVMISWPSGFPCNTTLLSIVSILIEGGRTTGYGWNIYDIKTQPYIMPFNQTGSIITRTPEIMNLPENTSMNLDYSVASTPYSARPVVVIQYRYPSGQGWDAIDEYHYDKSTGILLKYVGIRGAGQEYELQAKLNSIILIGSDKLYEQPSLALASTSLTGAASGITVAWLVYRLIRPPRA